MFKFPFRQKPSIPPNSYQKFTNQRLTLSGNATYTDCSFVSCTFTLNDEPFNFNTFVRCIFINCTFTSNFAPVHFYQCTLDNVFLDHSTVHFEFCDIDNITIPKLIRLSAAYSYFSSSTVGMAKCTDSIYGEAHHSSLGTIQPYHENKIPNFESFTLRDTRVELNETNPYHFRFHNITPAAGPFYGYKKAQSGNDTVIITLLIPEDSKRISIPSSRKCRAEKAYVVSIESLDGAKTYTEATSKFHTESPITYKTGEIIEADGFSDILIDCARGIHFFMTKEEAKEFRI